MENICFSFLKRHEFYRFSFEFASELDEYEIFHLHSLFFFSPLSFNNTFFVPSFNHFSYDDKFPKRFHALRFTSSLNHFSRCEMSKMKNLTSFCSHLTHRWDVMCNFNFPFNPFWSIWQHHAPFVHNSYHGISSDK